MRLSEIDPDECDCLEDLVIWGTEPLSSVLCLLDERLDDDLNDNNPEDRQTRALVTTAINWIADLTDALYRFGRYRIGRKTAAAAGK